MDDLDTQLTEALDLLGAVADELTAQDAAEELDDATLQAFWRDWPRHSAWAGALWRLLNADLEDSAQPVGDRDTNEIGGSG